MRIQTKIAVNYNQGAAGTVSGIIQGVILSAGWVNNPKTNKFDSIGINYEYTLPTGEVFFKDGLTIRGEVEIQGLYDAIKSQIPEGLDKAENEQIVFYLAFIQSMADTFGCEPSDVEIL
jgi:hypothetical protein